MNKEAYTTVWHW